MIEESRETVNENKCCKYCACYEEEWEYCFRHGNRAPVDGSCKYWREEVKLPKEAMENVKMSDAVNHPAYYSGGGIEVIDAIEAWGFGEGFNRGNAIKYIARAGRKYPAKEVEDLKKARFYIEAEIRRLEGKTAK